MELGKIIGRGNTASVYEWDEDTIVKLFYREYPIDAVLKEYKNTIFLEEAIFLYPRVHGLIRENQQNGIIYDRITGDTILERLLHSRDITKDIYCYGKIFVHTHKRILENSIPDLSSYKESLTTWIMRGPGTKEEKERICEEIQQLPDGEGLCHGDYHPGNVMIQEKQVFVIDMMNLCKGPAMYDIARTYYLICESELPDELKENKEFIDMRALLGEYYLRGMGIKEEEIKKYLNYIMLAREGEVSPILE